MGGKTLWSLTCVDSPAPSRSYWRAMRCLVNASGLVMATRWLDTAAAVDDRFFNCRIKRDAR